MQTPNTEINVLTSEKHEKYVANGVVSDVQSALEKFYGGADNIPDVAVKVGNQNVTDYSFPLHGGETVLILPKAVASGGFKMGN